VSINFIGNEPTFKTVIPVKIIEFEPESKVMKSARSETLKVTVSPGESSKVGKTNVKSVVGSTMNSISSF